jgi:redox-sensing transcriptional repressor
MDQSRPDPQLPQQPLPRPLMPPKPPLPLPLETRGEPRPDLRPELVPNPAVRRLSLYLRQLEGFKRKDRRTISSRQLGESLGLTDAQVRKDLAYFGQFGHPGIGYRVDDLIAQVRRILGTDKVWNVLLVGAGNLGRALSAYKGFNAKGFRLVAIFDADPTKVGRKLGPFLIQQIAELNDVVHKQQIRLAMVAVPADNAQGVVDQLVAAGVRGILNFAPVSVTVPQNVALNAVDLSVQLEQLSFQVNVSPPLGQAG